MLWVLEREVFDETGHEQMVAAVRTSGGRVLEWDDRWWREGLPTPDGDVVFHGSLGNASALAERSEWMPGAYCATKAFQCSAWYPSAASWLLQERYLILPAARLAEDPDAAFDAVGAGDEAFIRPDSPLKAFSGRVLAREAVSLAALDHGFYFDDPELPVVVAPKREVGREWRFVVVEKRVVAGSGYIADGRQATGSANDPAWRFAAEVAEALDPPEAVYVLDVCECEAGLRLLELNPFSGADLYACDRDAVVASVSCLRSRR